MACQFNLVLLILVIFCTLNAKAAKKVQPRIVGGRATTSSEVPWIVNLRKKGQPFCGGSLASEKFVITAAHCVKSLAASALTVHGGNTYLSRTGVVRRVAKIFIPSGFSLRTMAMDVAVLKLKSKMTGSNIKPIPLCSGKLLAGSLVTISGWGYQSENSRNVQNQVRIAQVQILTKARCSRDYKNRVAIRNTMVCASIPGQKDACSGDSGGPLVRKGQLCGIVSFGVGCGRSAYPGVYTKVSAVRSFIDGAMKK